MARNDHSGYPMKWFKDQNSVRNAYECVICLEVVKDAVQIRVCGHQFCALCIDDILKTDPRCPTCRIDISEAMVFEDQAARRLIRQFDVNCCNEGCAWQGCLSSLLQAHQNNCKSLIQCEDNDAHKLKVEELEQKHDTLMLKVILFEEKHEQDITVLRVKHEQDIQQLQLKHQQDIEDLRLKHQKDIGDLQSKHEQEKQGIRELQLKHEQEKEDIKEFKFKHEQDIEELKVKLQQAEDLWKRIKGKEKELCDKEEVQETTINPQESPTRPMEVYKESPIRPMEVYKESPTRPMEVYELKKSKNPWKRAKEREKHPSLEAKKTAKLYRNVIAILNKLTPQKFKSLVEQVMALNIDTPERLEGVIHLIYETAIRQPMYCVAYANMCRCLFTIKVADAEGKDVSFRKLLLNRCQNEFEKEKEDEKGLLEKNPQLKGLLEEEKKVKKEEMDETLAKNKRRMLGNIKFIGELFKLKLLTENIMHDCIFKLLRAGDEESLESMCTLLFTIGKDLDYDKAKPRIEQYFDEINKVLINKKVSSRVVFMLRDVVDLRENQWVPRREENYNPKTIDQIHKEAQLEKIQKRRLAAQLPSKNNKEKKGAPGGRDSPKPTSNDAGKDRKSLPIGQNKLRSMAKRANYEEIPLGPSSRFGQWGRGSSAGSNNSSQAQDQPQGNRYSALSRPTSRPRDPRRPGSGGSRPSSGDPRGSVESRIKSDKDRESALEAVRNLTKPQNEKPQATTQLSPTSQEKQEVKVAKESKETVKEPAREKPKTPEPLSEEELAKKTTAIIDEYANIRDMREVIECFTELHSPDLHHLFILTAVEHTYEMASRARHDTGRLFAELLSQKKISKDQLTSGFNNVLELAYDNSIDYPMLWRYLADIITPVILQDQFTLTDLKPLIMEHLHPVGKAAALLAEILLIIKEMKGEGKAVEVWKKLGLSWSQVLPERSSKEDFLSRKNLKRF